MGLFTTEPEDAKDWAGLPAEPIERDEVGEPSAPLSDDALMPGVLGGTTSVPIEVGLTDDDASDDDEPDDGEPDDGEPDAP